MGELPTRGPGSEPTTAQTETETVDSAERRPPKATVKGMVPLQRAPAPVDPDGSDS